VLPLERGEAEFADASSHPGADFELFGLRQAQIQRLLHFISRSSNEQKCDALAHEVDTSNVLVARSTVVHRQDNWPALISKTVLRVELDRVRRRAFTSMRRF
jgi:hypothetical protein